jgi:hypothetical protein
MIFQCCKKRSKKVQNHEYQSCKNIKKALGLSLYSMSLTCIQDICITVIEAIMDIMDNPVIKVTTDITKNHSNQGHCGRQGHHCHQSSHGRQGSHSWQGYHGNYGHHSRRGHYRNHGNPSRPGRHWRYQFIEASLDITNISIKTILDIMINKATMNTNWKNRHCGLPIQIH